MGPYPASGDLVGITPEVDVLKLAVRGGSQIAIQIQRADIVSGTEYTGSVGIINLRWRLIPVE